MTMNEKNIHVKNKLDLYTYLIKYLVKIKSLQRYYYLKFKTSR